MAISLLAMLLAGAPLWASLDEGAVTVPVTVWIYDGVGVSVDDITAARAAADAIFRRAGIAPVWFECRFVEGRWQGASDRCNIGVGMGAIIVRLVSASAVESSHVPLGEASLDIHAHTGSIATVFPDRVVNTSNRAGANARRVLGRVLAHEIGHLLIGTNRHSTTGLMRAIWTDPELRRTIGLEWCFSAAEARCMRAEIAQRSAGASAPAIDRWSECDPTRPPAPAKSLRAR